MDKKDYEKEIRTAAEGGKITCREAMKLSARLGVPMNQMAGLLNQYHVKIKACQLGCFE
jgi:hypothetical protein